MAPPVEVDSLLADGGGRENERPEWRVESRPDFGEFGFLLGVARAAEPQRVPARESDSLAVEVIDVGSTIDRPPEGDRPSCGRSKRDEPLIGRRVGPGLPGEMVDVLVEDGLEPPVDAIASDLDEDFIAGIRDLSVEGIDTLDNVDTYRTAEVLSAESSAASSLIGVPVEGWQGELKVAYWVGVDDSLIRKFTIGGELESNGQHRAFVSMIVGLSDFGAEFIIEVPELDLNSTATPLLTPTPIARPTASSANTPTPEPTATATPDVAKTPVSSSGLSPRPTVAPTDGLWAGELVPEPGQTGISLSRCRTTS